jgi:hypothetical protein
VRDAHELVDRDDPGLLVHRERRRRERRDVGRQVAGIDDAGPGGVESDAAQQRLESAIAQILGAPVKGDATGRRQTSQHAGVVLAHLCGAGPFVQPPFRAFGLHAAAAEQHGGDAVERR